MAIARDGRFVPTRQMVARRDPALGRQDRSTVHGVVFDFFVIRASVMEPNAG